MKDLPGKLPAGLTLGPVPERGAVHDVFVTREPLAWRESPAALRVGTSSPRRQAEIRRLNPRLIASPIRGNVTTRLEKLRLGNVDALVLAAAGLERLGIMPEFVELLAVEEFVPAPGQGALGLELREDDTETARLLESLRDPIADTCVRAERALLLALGGSCLLPLGALAGIRRGRLFLHGRLLSPDGRKVCDLQAEGDARRPVAVAEELAARMLEKGGAEILSAVADREKGR
jgi:hydroxymethylbilane synthase